MYILSQCYSKQQKISKQRNPDLPHPESQSWKRADFHYFLSVSWFCIIPEVFWVLALLPRAIESRGLGSSHMESLRDAVLDGMSERLSIKGSLYFPVKSSSGLTAREEKMN